MKSAGHQSTHKIKCPPGQIERKGYVRRFDKTIIEKGYTVKRANGKQYRIYPERASVYVKPICVEDKGLPGKLGSGEGFGPIRKGELKKYGYTYLQPEHIRHASLKKGIDEFGALGVYHKLDAIVKLSRRTVPEASRVFRKDREWLRLHYKLKAF